MSKKVFPAFLQYSDSGATLLRPGHYPIVGRDALQYLQNINDSYLSLSRILTLLPGKKRWPEPGNLRWIPAIQRW